MALIQLVLSLGVLVLIVHGDQDVFNVNDLLDRSLRQFSENVLRSQDITAHYENITVGKYTLRGARLADISTLKRTSDALMWNEGQTVIVNGTLSLGSMFVTAVSLDGPTPLSEPLITIK